MLVMKTDRCHSKHGQGIGGRERELGRGTKKVRQQSAATTTMAKGSLSCLVRVFDGTHGFETIL